MTRVDIPGERPEVTEPTETPPEELPSDPEELKKLLVQKSQEAKENYDRLLRLAAEVDNLKKRQEREISEVRQFANENLIKELLPVLDNLERALEHGRQNEAPEALMEGLELVHQDFLKVLGRFGITPIDSVGERFNPVFHHAVMEEESPEVEDQTVTNELQRGYLLQNRLLRPAMVVVSRNTAQSEGKTKIDKTV
ncbi:MAG: nucleotide exchange factor GrpE [Thermodesulfobacteriota bacterium]|jgi:molecular chaperone GrpE